MSQAQFSISSASISHVSHASTKNKGGHWQESKSWCLVSNIGSTRTQREGLSWNVVSGKRVQRIRCSKRGTSVSESEDKQGTWKSAEDISLGTAMEFKLSDFDLCSYVSIGLSGRGDEILFEGVVRNNESPIKGMRVVLRQLTGRRAQRWGHRALQVLPRLVPREDLYNSYTTRVHGYILAPGGKEESSMLTLVHGYYGSYSLHHWLISADWLPNLEARLALDEEAARRVGDDRTGGPEVSRQLRLIRILMRDLLIGVNYLHSRGLAHTELRLQNIQISAADRHVKVGLLGNAADFPSSSTVSLSARNPATRELLIAYDIRCVGFMLAKMVLRELMDPAVFAPFKSFLTQGNDPDGLREFLLPLVHRVSPSGSAGVQILDRDGGTGWHLLSSMLATKPSDRISCRSALRHPFLCGPMWRVESSIELTRWSIGSSTVRIVEEYIYGNQQRNRIEKLIYILERMNPRRGVQEWKKQMNGKWRFLYCTGKHIGLTSRQASPAVLIKHLIQTFTVGTEAQGTISTVVEVDFTVMTEPGKWPLNKNGAKGKLKVEARNIEISEGDRLYVAEEKQGYYRSSAIKDEKFPTVGAELNSRAHKKSRHVLPEEPGPVSMPIVRLTSSELEMEMELDYTGPDQSLPSRSLREVRIQIPRELFDVSGLVCASYIDSRFMVLRGITGSALLYVRSPKNS